jgi:putative membrane protein
VRRSAFAPHACERRRQRLRPTIWPAVASAGVTGPLASGVPHPTASDRCREETDIDHAEHVDEPDEAFAPRPETVRAPLRGGGPILRSAVVGAAMGVAELVPGFSGGTVALVAGIYERLVANVRQGARMLSLAGRGRLRAAGRAFARIEWPFVGALLVGMGATLLGLAGVLGQLLEARPVEVSAVFLGLVLGAAAVASGQVRAPRVAHVVVGAAIAAVTFVGLGAGGAGGAGGVSLTALYLGAAIAACAWILPGVSGAFLLLLLGLYPAALAAVATRDVVAIAVLAAGALSGLALFSTLLNWLLTRWHDLVLAAMVGLLVGSSRVLWPWPSSGGVGDPTLGAPEAETAVITPVLALVAGVAVWGLARAGRRADA